MFARNACAHAHGTPQIALIASNAALNSGKVTIAGSGNTFQSPVFKKFSLFVFPPALIHRLTRRDLAACMVNASAVYPPVGSGSPSWSRLTFLRMIAEMRERAFVSASESLARKSMTSQLAKVTGSIRLNASSVLTNFAPIDAGVSEEDGRPKRI